MIRHVLCAALAIPLVAVGQPVVFDFESGQLPASCILESGRVAQPKGDFVRAGADEVRGGGVFLTENAERGGVFIRSSRADADVLTESLPALTVCVAFRANPLSASPVFLERLAGGSSENAGFFRFRSQSNDGDDNERRGTLRFYTKGADGRAVSATSTVPWIQQANAWNWVGLVFDKGRVTFYLNGERLGDDISIPLEEIPTTDGNSYYLRGGYGFVGAFDDLAILPGKAFTDDEMQAAYRHGIGSKELRNKLKE